LYINSYINIYIIIFNKLIL